MVSRVAPVMAICLGVALAVSACQRGSKAEQLSAAQSKELFETACASCHGRDGVPPPNGPHFPGLEPLAGPEVQARDDETLFRSIANGKGSMPGFAQGFSEPQLRGLVRYVRALKR